MFYPGIEVTKYASFFVSILSGMAMLSCVPSVTEKDTQDETSVEVNDGEQGQLSDSGDSGNSEDTAIELGEAPYITDASGSFEEYPNIGMVIEIKISYLDAQDDVDDGFLHLDYSSGRGSGSVQTNIDGHQVYVDEGVANMAFTNVNSNMTYSFTAMLEDIEGHLSQRVSFEVAAN